MKYGLSQYFQPSPKNIQKWLLALKGLMTTIGGATYFQDPKMAFWILVATGVVNELGNLFGSETNG